MSVSTPIYRMTAEKENIIQKELKEKSGIISRHLGYQGV
jgi:DNA-binding IclR family transcriptional regulator